LAPPDISAVPRKPPGGKSIPNPGLFFWEFPPEQKFFKFLGRSPRVFSKEIVNFPGREYFPGFFFPKGGSPELSQLLGIPLKFFGKKSRPILGPPVRGFSQSFSKGAKRVFGESLRLVSPISPKAQGIPIYIPKILGFREDADYFHITTNNQ